MVHATEETKMKLMKSEGKQKIKRVFQIVAILLCSRLTCERVTNWLMCFLPKHHIVSFFSSIGLLLEAYTPEWPVRDLVKMSLNGLKADTKKKKRHSNNNQRTRGKE